MHGVGCPESRFIPKQELRPVGFGLAGQCRKAPALPQGNGIRIALHHETRTVYVGASSEISQCGGGFFLRGIRMYHDSTMLENAKAMPREAAIVLSI
jgi:hypothetical protein